jgi:hypothetical protein
MELTEEERFAVTMLFRGRSNFELAVLDGLKKDQVSERKFTGVGYLSTILLSVDLPPLTGKLLWNFNFDHQFFDYGGSFIAYCELPNIVELEAVHDGSWPAVFSPDLFSER